MCFTALMIEVTGDCYLPQGVTEAWLKKSKCVQSHRTLRTDVTWIHERKKKSLCYVERTSRVERMSVSVPVHIVVSWSSLGFCCCLARLAGLAGWNRKSLVGAHIEEGSPVNCICASLSNY